jgi:Mg/Co/Ni transporter MgtE
MMLKLQNKEEVQELIAQRNLLGLRHLLAECEPNEVAHLIDGFTCSG